MSFRNTILAIHQISNCYEKGLQALDNNNRTKIVPANNRHLEGSVDIDSCLSRSFPNASRWDYVLCYDSKVYCIEVHPASGGEVKSVINKANWLKRWLQTTGASIIEYNGSYPTCHWIASGKVTILRDSNYARRLAEAGVQFPKELMRIP